MKVLASARSGDNALVLMWWLTMMAVPVRGNGLPFNKDSKRLRLDGDVIFGGIFPMHEAWSGKCGAVKEEKGVQRLEAMLFALDLINNDTNLLPNLTLGAHIVDSCSSDTYALEQSMEFVTPFINKDMSEYDCADGTKPLHKPHKRVAGVVGASFSVVSIMVANILRLFKVPQMSYASTSTELSDKSRFEYFSRVVPPDNFQAQAMFEIVKTLGWKYVSTVAVEGEYGEKGIASFLTLAQRGGVCIALSEKILRHSKTDDFDEIIERLASKPGARGVIMFVDEDNIRKLLQASVRANRTGQLLWVASDSWGAKHYPVRDQEFAAEGAITILPTRKPLPDYDAYFQALRPAMDFAACNRSGGANYWENGNIINCRNIWFREFWRQHQKCEFEFEDDGEEEQTQGQDQTRYATLCTGHEEIHDYEEEGLVPFVVDAVYAMAHGVHNLLTDVCGHPGYVCQQLHPVPPGPLLLNYIRQVNFIGPQGTEVKFNKDGDAFGSYTIFQYQRLGNKYDYVKVGTWKEKLDIQLWRTRWKTYGSQFSSSDLPKSLCNDPCPVGHIRNFVDNCCYVCVPCRDDALATNDTCEPCALGWAPNKNRTICLKLKPETIPWSSPWAAIPLSFSGGGMFLTFLTILVFIKFNSTPVIMASGRELCYVLLTGIMSCYGMPFVVLATPNAVSCTFLRLGLGLCLSICYSAILTKTNRISRIFNGGAKAIKPAFTSPRSQILISMSIVSVQLVGGVVWLCIDHPDVKEIYPAPMVVIKACAVSTFSLMMSLVYNMVLIILCTIYAFKTRKIPENFNEAKYIGFTMYSTCIVWLAFVPTYFGANNDYRMQVASICMCINISAAVALGCLFSPKLYIVMCQPEKNVRQANMLMAGARAGYSMRYTAAAGVAGTAGAGVAPEPRVQMLPAGAVAASAAVVASNSATISSRMASSDIETSSSCLKEEPPDS